MSCKFKGGQFIIIFYLEGGPIPGCTAMPGQPITRELQATFHLVPVQKSV